MQQVFLGDVVEEPWGYGIFLRFRGLTGFRPDWAVIGWGRGGSRTLTVKGNQSVIDRRAIEQKRAVPAASRAAREPSKKGVAEIEPQQTDGVQQQVSG
jgi:hypothetical protein